MCIYIFIYMPIYLYIFTQFTQHHVDFMTFMPKHPCSPPWSAWSGPEIWYSRLVGVAFILVGSSLWHMCHGGAGQSNWWITWDRPMGVEPSWFEIANLLMKVIICPHRTGTAPQGGEWCLFFGPFPRREKCSSYVAKQVQTSSSQATRAIEYLQWKSIIRRHWFVG